MPVAFAIKLKPSKASLVFELSEPSSSVNLFRNLSSIFASSPSATILASCSSRRSASNRSRHIAPAIVAIEERRKQSARGTLIANVLKINACASRRSDHVPINKILANPMLKRHMTNPNTTKTILCRTLIKVGGVDSQLPFIKFEVKHGYNDDDKEPREHVLDYFHAANGMRVIW